MFHWAFTFTIITVSKRCVWVLHELTQKNFMGWISLCKLMLNSNKIDPFLKRVVTGDEKWITYNNIKRKGVSVESRWAGANVGQARTDVQESFAMCLVGLVGNHLLWVSASYHNFSSSQHNLCMGDGRGYHTILLIFSVYEGVLERLVLSMFFCCNSSYLWDMDIKLIRGGIASTL